MQLENIRSFSLTAVILWGCILLEPSLRLT